MMNNQREFQQNTVMGSGLTRYRSAPCSYFSTLLNSSNIMGDDGFGEDEFERILNPPASNPETQKFFSRFMNNSETIQENCSSDMKSQSHINPQYPPPRKSESSVHKPRKELQRQQSNDFSSVPHMMYQIINSGAANSDYGLMDSLNSWDDLPDSFFKGLTDNHQQQQSIEGGSKHTLSHHLSLPKNSLAMEKLMQGSVPCKIRAKRGFATHPRSIAERVRRTKISERMRKLQDLVPNMEKQTNTSDMLDLAVDYIKDLQRQVKTLSDNHAAKCSCSARQKP